MPTWEVTSPSGQTLSLEGDKPPTEGDLNNIFSKFKAEQPSSTTASEAPAERSFQSPGSDIREAYNAGKITKEDASLKMNQLRNRLANQGASTAAELATAGLASFGENVGSTAVGAQATIAAQPVIQPIGVAAGTAVGLASGPFGVATGPATTIGVDALLSGGVFMVAQQLAKMGIGKAEKMVAGEAVEEAKRKAPVAEAVGDIAGTAAFGASSAQAIVADMRRKAAGLVGRDAAVAVGKSIGSRLAGAGVGAATMTALNPVLQEFTEGKRDPITMHTVWENLATALIFSGDPKHEKADFETRVKTSEALRHVFEEGEAGRAIGDKESIEKQFGIKLNKKQWQQFQAIHRGNESVDQAAIMQGGKRYTGVSHRDIIADNKFDPAVRDSKDSGFITSKGRFVSRAEAQQIAEHAGQVDAQPEGHELHSQELQDGRKPIALVTDVKVENLGNGQHKVSLRGKSFVSRFLTESQAMKMPDVIADKARFDAAEAEKAKADPNYKPKVYEFRGGISFGADGTPLITIKSNRNFTDPIFTHEIIHAMEHLGIITKEQSEAVLKKYLTERVKNSVDSNYAEADRPGEYLAHILEDWHRNGGAPKIHWIERAVNFARTIIGLDPTSAYAAKQSVEEILGTKPGTAGTAMPQGAGTKFASGMGMTFVSPNVEKNINFETAHSRLNSPKQKELQQFTREASKLFLLDVNPKQVIGDWSDGAENSIMTVVPVTDFGKMKALAAFQGLISKQKAVIPFAYDKKGGSAVHNIALPMGITDARRELGNAGLQFRTLIPQGEKTQVIIFDSDRSLGDTVSALIEKHNAAHFTIVGKGEYVGKETREEALNDYRAILERSRREHAPSTGAGLWGADFARRLEAAERGLKSKYSAGGRPLPPSAEGVGLEERGREVRSQVRAGSRPNEFVRKGSDDYAAKYGFPEIYHGHYVEVSEKTAKSIAEEYEKLPKVDESPETAKAYRALGKEIQQQWDFAKDVMGIKMEPWAKEGQPYANSGEMVQDVRDNKHIWFFTGGEPHPFLDAKDSSGFSLNEKLRAIHDLFGHAAEDYQFGPRGEENAWLKHSQMFSEEAQKALTTETRAQNSWTNNGPQNYNADGSYKNIPPSERPFADQKVALMPDWATDWKSVLSTDKSSSGGEDLEKEPSEKEEPTKNNLDQYPAAYEGGRAIVSVRQPGSGDRYEVLHAGLSSMDEDPVQKAKAAKVLSEYPSIRGKTEGKNPDQIIRQFLDVSKRNLKFLYDLMPPEWRERSRLWYDGAKRISVETAEHFNITNEQSAGVFASLSPQKDWFMNVSLGKRAIRAFQELSKANTVFSTEYYDHAYDRAKPGLETSIKEAIKRNVKKKGRFLDPDELAPKIEKSKQKALAENEKRPEIHKNKEKIRLKGNSLEKYLKSIEINLVKENDAKQRNQRQLDARVKTIRDADREKWEAIKRDYVGKVWNDISIEGKSRFLRAYDEMLHGNTFEIITPEGEMGGLKTNNDGTPSGVAWNSYDMIEKCISILQDGSIENISNQLGTQHKVRNFFNNISDPQSKIPFVTTDTHHVAASNLRPFAGGDAEVLIGFGGTPRSRKSGMGGTYAIYVQACVELAEELGKAEGRHIDPREIQSITWEAVRGFFTDTFKTGANKGLVESIWNEFAEGKLSEDETRQKIKDLVKQNPENQKYDGIKKPDWVDTPARLSPDKVKLFGSVVHPISADISGGGGDARLDTGRPPRAHTGRRDGLVRRTPVGIQAPEEGSRKFSSGSRSAEDTYREVGLTKEDVEEWRGARRTNVASSPGAGRKERVPSVQEMARRYSDLEISQDEYLAAVKQHMPIVPITDRTFPSFPTFQEIVSALKPAQVEKGIIGFNKSIPEGASIGLRLDIPAYNTYDTWVVTAHEDGPGGAPIAYGQTGVLNNVSFKSDADKAIKVATGEQDKSSFAKMFGQWQNVPPEQVFDQARKLINDPNWVQVGMNPFRHSFFYDKANGRPVVSAAKILQVGPLVLAPKDGLVYAEPNDPRFMTKKGMAFSSGGAVPESFKETKLVDEAGNPKMVFHGTTQDIKGEFKIPAFFTTKREYAENLGRKIVEAYLNIKNPADLRAMHISPSEPNFAEIAKQLESKGYDGAQYRDEAWIAFHPNQIHFSSGAAPEPVAAPKPVDTGKVKRIIEKASGLAQTRKRRSEVNVGYNIGMAFGNKSMQEQKEKAGQAGFEAGRKQGVEEGKQAPGQAPTIKQRTLQVAETQKTEFYHQAKPLVEDLRERLAQSVGTMEALTEVLRAQERAAAKGYKKGAFDKEQDLRVTHDWLTAESRGLQEDLISYLQAGLPKEYHSMFMRRIAEATRPPNIVTGEPKTMFHRVAAVAELIETKAKEVHKKELINDLKERYLKSVSSPGVDVNVKAKLRALMVDFGLTRMSPSRRQRLEATKAYIEKMEAAGLEHGVPQNVIEDIELLNKKSLSELPVEVLQAMHDNVMMMDHMGRLIVKKRNAQKLLRAQVALQDLMLQKTNPMDDKDLVKPSTFGELSTVDRAKNAITTARNKTAFADKMLMPIDALMDWMDGGKGDYNGWLFRNIRNQLDLAFNKKTVHSEEILQPVRDAQKKYNLKNSDGQKIGVYAIAGMEDGIQRLLDSGISSEDIAEAQSEFNRRKDYQEVYKHMRESMDALLPQIQKIMREEYNIEVKPVDAYFPLLRDYSKYQPKLEESNAYRDLSEADRDGLGAFLEMQGDFTTRSTTETRKNFTIERKKNAATPVKYNAFDIFNQHINDVTHFLSSQRDLKHMNRMVKSDMFKEKYGTLGQRVIADWLDTYARQGRVGGNQRIRWMDTLRRNTGMGMIAFRVVSGFKHLSNVPLAIQRAGVKHYWSAMNDIVTGKAEDFMRQNFAETYERGGGEPSLVEAAEAARHSLKKAAHWGFIMERQIDKLNAQACALGTYKRIMEEKLGTGFDYLNQPVDHDAQSKAMVLSRRAVASPTPKDVPLALSRGALTGGNVSVARSLMQFSNIMLDQWSNIRHDFVGAGILENNPKLAANMLLAVAAVILSEYEITTSIHDLENKILGYQDNREKHVGKELALDALHRVPFAGNILNMVAGHSAMPLLDVGAEAFKGGSRMISGKTPQSRITGAIGAAGAAATLAGIPASGQISEAAQKYVRGRYQ